MCEKRVAFRLLATVSVASFLVLSNPIGLWSTEDGNQSAQAQGIETSNVFGNDPPAASEQLLLESDELVYDNDRGLVIATGNVQLAYGRSTLVADRIEYNQQSGRVIAIGNVEILEPDGNRIFAHEIDITDDFSDGFVSALNVQTADETRVVAESAERRDGSITQFNNSVYTACQPCKENPEKPPFWQIRAKTVVINKEKETIEYEDAKFEINGVPIISLPRFAHADPAVKRKSGLLMPSYKDVDVLGFGYRQGYFFNLAPNYDFTVWGTYYDRQGFLGEAEWRHRLANGEYSIRYAAIDQQEPGAFAAGRIDALETDRQALMTRGLFDLTPRWQLGWRALFQSDENFARTYDLQSFDTRDITNEIYLVGRGEKNYFDLRGQDFMVQDNQIDISTVQPGNQTFDQQQATILPLLDYNAVSGSEFQNGQISFDLNVANVSRDNSQISNSDQTVAVVANERFTGLQGETARASAEIEWKASQITGNGLVVTTALSGRADAIYQDTDNLNSAFNPLTSNDSIFRTMPAGMLEIRYPLIATTGYTTHIFEPIAQVIARPDEENIGQFANEDAQSLVFDTSNLFERDKFSGFDRVEGGTRANIGFRYSASFMGGGNLEVVAGQYIHLAGTNSFAATNDLTNTGEESGLETDRSDYVASLQVNDGQGISAGVSVRLDEEDLGLKRAEVRAGVTQPDYNITGSYIFTEAQPNYRFDRDRHEVKGAGSLSLDDNWRAFASATYDIETATVIKEGVGLAYHDDCFSFSISYANSRREFTGESTGRSINFSLGLRTVGGFTHTHDISDDN